MHGVDPRAPGDASITADARRQSSGDARQLRSRPPRSPSREGSLHLASSRLSSASSRCWACLDVTAQLVGSITKQIKQKNILQHNRLSGLVVTCLFLQQQVAGSKLPGSKFFCQIKIREPSQQLRPRMATLATWDPLAGPRRWDAVAMSTEWGPCQDCWTHR